MKFASIAKTAERFLSTNSPAILAGVGVVGVVTTAVLTGKATIKATDIIREYEHHIEEGRRANVLDDLTVKEKVDLTWKLYIPPVVAGATTIGAIVCANRIGMRRTAAVAAAYSLSEKAFGDYKEKVMEKLGEKQHQAVKDEVAQDLVDKNPPKAGDIVVMGSGDVLCLDAYTGRYFHSTMETIRGAQNSVNEIIFNHMNASLSDFYGMIGLPSTSFSDEVGWTTDNPMKLLFSSVLVDGGKPCLVVDFENAPLSRYYKMV